jgi:hypothetical protein
VRADERMRRGVVTPLTEWSVGDKAFLDELIIARFRTASCLSDRSCGSLSLLIYRPRPVRGRSKECPSNMKHEARMGDKWLKKQFS